MVLSLPLSLPIPLSPIPSLPFPHRLLYKLNQNRGQPFLPPMRALLLLLLATTAVFGQKTVRVAVEAPEQKGSSEFESFLNDDKLVKATADDFVAQNSRFRFTSEKKDSARVDGKRMYKNDIPTFQSLPIVESLIRFTPAGNELTMILYSVGDLGPINEDKFNGIVDNVTKALTKAYGNPSAPTAAASVIVRAKSLAWKCPAGSVRLEWSSTRADRARNIAYRAEFIRVVVGAPQTLATPSAAATRWNPADQLRTNPEGDKWIATVPMVDQGQKGYCAVATGERVLRYFGKDADEHELAQACQTEDGTSGAKFEEQMKRVATRFGLRFQTYLSGGDEKMINKILKDYTAAGKKKDGTPIPQQLQQNPYLFYSALDALKPEQLAAVRQADKIGIALLDRSVRESIDRANPVIWAVHLGIIPEPDIPQAQGGHIRLIIGYNAKTAEILYSDSWGPKHELKRMKIADAWAETFGLYVMRPN